VIHACFGDLLHDRFDSAPVVFALQLALTIPLAALSWYLFEEPILRRKRSWPMPARRPVGAPAPAVFGVAEGL
jgi:peptidoglycan/LPS O-acetylase OafA/YrhL